MDRRTFLKATGAASLLAPTLIREALAAQSQPLVAVAEGTDYPAITRRAKSPMPRATVSKSGRPSCFAA